MQCVISKSRPSASLWRRHCALGNAYLTIVIIISVIAFASGLNLDLKTSSTYTPLYYRTTTAPTTTAMTSTTRRTRPLWNETETDRLKHDLLLGYDKFARPQEHHNVTDVELYMNAKHISLDEFMSMLTVDAWIRMTWHDPKLQWNASLYGNLSELHLGDHEVWQPDIVLYNSASPGFPVIHYDTPHMLVVSSGQVQWVPPTRLQVFCALDLRYWPFDSHTCELRMGSWVYDSGKLDITVFNDSFSHDELIENSEWDIVGTTNKRNEMIYPCCPEAYVDVTFYITLKRVPGSYRSVVVAPVTVAILLCLSTFWLSPQSGEKIFLGGVNTLLLTAFLIFLGHEIPILGKHTPYVVVFYSWSLYLVSLSVGVSILVLNLSRQPRCVALPLSVRRLLKGKLGTILMLSNYIDKTMLERSQCSEMLETHPVILADHLARQIDEMESSCSPGAGVQDGGSTSTSSAQRDWILLAATVDRVVFLFYCFLFSLLAIVFAV